VIIMARLQLKTDEVHFYDSGTKIYTLDKDDEVDHEILYVWGWVSKTENYGVIRHSFVNNVDYEQVGAKIRWLSGGDVPSPPPSFMGITRTPFYVSYVYRNDLSTRIRGYLYPFIKEGLATAFVDAIATQGDRLLDERDRIRQSRSLVTAGGVDLDLMGDWYNANRLPGESDNSFRSRLENFLSVFLSSGTKSSIMNVIKAFTGVTPGIYELWAQTAYWNYNPNDTSIVYYWTSYDDPNPTEPIAYWWDFTFQLSTFYVILPLATINEFGITALKSLIESSKASGVMGYLGYLVDETFADGNDDNWEPQTDVKGETSVPADWVVDSSDLDYVYTSSGTASGMSVVSDEYHLGCDDWEDYVVTAYCQNNTTTDSVNIKVGIVTRWDEDNDEFYFFGICTFNNTYYIYKYESSTWTLIVSDNQDADGNALTFDKDTWYHFRVSIDGGGARFYVDNDLMYAHSTNFNEIQKGRPGFAAITAATAIKGRFDDMTVVV